MLFSPLVFLLVVSVFVVYLLPSLVRAGKEGAASWGFVLSNVFLGWTVVVWATLLFRAIKNSLPGDAYN